MRCDSCFRSEPSAYVELHHNVGMLIMRREYATAGHLCRPCLNRAFWRHTLYNLTLGWWGTISFFMTWYFLASNLLSYVQARREIGNRRPLRESRKTATGEEAQRTLAPFEHNVRMRLRDGDDLGVIAADLARTHDVELEAARRFIDGLLAADARAEDAPRTLTGS